MGFYGQKFEEWKQNLPDFSWMNEAFPKPESVDKIRISLGEIKDKFSSENGFFKRVSANLDRKVDVFNQWLEEAKEARQRNESRLTFLDN